MEKLEDVLILFDQHVIFPSRVKYYRLRKRYINLKRRNPFFIGFIEILFICFLFAVIVWSWT